MNTTLEQRIQQLEDRAALKHLIDHFANLADDKDVANQMFLFTEDAAVDTYFGDTLFASMRGRDEIGKVFTAFLANFEIVYHMNGQQTVEVNGDKASSIHYCQVVLISTVDGKKIKNTNGIIYKDEYVRQDGKWLIAKRLARFTWRDEVELKTPNV
ncbi:nuclear transport factor 2 family protein [Sulfurospirillum arsenophilum]|uniref:nuclear transport factor 2 family protein n=1 Tax=Sulfurospirillum arsenophilum TaxID=56698 RepID=UPI0005AB0314|nr:nuclear transport factor 2 family protein [Sulfurospirillum arsenophilum]